MAAIHEHGQLNPSGPAEIVERVERRARGAPAEQYIVHQHHRLTGDVERNHGRTNLRSHLLAEVVAVHPHIQAPDRHRLSPNIAQEIRQSLRQMHTSALHAHQDDLCAQVIPLGDFVRDARQGALQRGGI